MTGATLQGKSVWITGASSGIGASIAKVMARAGAMVHLSARGVASLEETRRAILETGGSAQSHPCDVSDEQAVMRTAQVLAAQSGAVDILVNNAGANASQRRWKDVTPDVWKTLLDVNLNGVFLCTLAVLPGVREKRSGLVINIASWFGRFDGYLAGPAYAAAKHAVVSLSASLNREECLNGIRACALCPGEVATPALRNRPEPPRSGDLEKMLQPDAIARVALFVAESPASVCFNEIVMTPTNNRLVLGYADPKRI